MHDTGGSSPSTAPSQRPARLSNPIVGGSPSIKAAPAEGTTFPTNNTGCLAPFCAFRKKSAGPELANDRCYQSIFIDRSRSELTTTDKELRLMAATASIGLRSRWLERG